MAEPLIDIPRKSAFTFAAFLVLYEFLTYIANDMIMPGMVNVVQTFEAEEAAIPTSLTAYILGGASLQVFLGPLSDRYGRRPVMLYGAVLFLICTLLVAFAQSIGQFLFLRFLEGMGLCFIGVIGYTTLQEIFEEVDAIKLIALLANVALIAPLLGPLMGSAFLMHFHWRMMFVMIGGFAILTLIGLYRYMPETVNVMRRDGTVNKSISLAPRNIARSYCQLLTDPKFLLGCFTIGMLEIPCLIWIALAPIILINDNHFSLVGYALWQIPVFGLLIAGNLTMRRLTNFISVTRIAITGVIFSTVGLVVGAALLLYNPTVSWLILGLSLYAFGLGLAAGPLNRQVLFCTPVTKGTASALMSIIVMGALAAGIEGSRYLFELKSHDIIIISLLCVASGLLCLLMVFGFYFLRTNGDEKT